MRAKNVWLRDLYGSSYGSGNPAATSAAAIPRPRNTRPGTSGRHNIRSCVQYRPRFGLGAISTRSWVASINLELPPGAVPGGLLRILISRKADLYITTRRIRTSSSARRGTNERGKQAQVCDHGELRRIPMKREPFAAALCLAMTMALVSCRDVIKPVRVSSFSG